MESHIDYDLNHHNQKIVYNIFNKYLPDNYFWDRDTKNRMDIFDESKSLNTQKIIFDNVDDFPMIIFSTNFEIDSKSNRLLSSIYFNNLTLQGLFKTKEFSEHDKLEKACRFISFSNAGVEDLFFLIFFQ